MFRAAGKWIKENWTYIDIVLAFAGGVVVSILGLFNKINDEQLTQATVAVVAGARVLVAPRPYRS